MRRHYWSCSKFADLIRGTKKIKSGTAKQWKRWKQLSESTHSFRHWAAEELLDRIQDVVFWVPDQIKNIKYYISNRWISKSHTLTAHKNHIERGKWCDVSGRIFPCLFDTLSDFVEIELPSLVDENKKKYGMKIWHRFPFVIWRNRQAGLDHLDWEMTLINDENNCCFDKNDPEYGKPTSQAISAKEIKDLYIWWNDIYPNRPDPYAISGWSEYCALKRKGDSVFDLLADDEDEKTTEIGNKSLRLLRQIESEYEEEDTEMMIRLIKIRDRLWT